MLRWSLLVIAMVSAAFGLLTVTMAPPWLPWQLAVLAGEFGHWFAGGTLALSALACVMRRRAGQLAWPTLALLLTATALLLKPAIQASRIAATLPQKLSASFGGTSVTRQPFAWRELFFWRAPAPMSVQTLETANGLAIDFYRPIRARNAGLAPCVIVVHGGGWVSGDRKQIPELNRWIAQRGYAVAAISYRFAPKFIWPAQRDDVLAEIAFLKTHATELGIDPTRLVLLGRSAGGQIAQVVAYTADDPAIRGLVALYAPSDLIFGYTHTHENDAIKSPSLMRQFLGGTPDTARANYESASAYFQVKRGAPPTLLITGENDGLVWYLHSVRLEARLAEAGVPCGFVLLPWATHAFDFNLHGPGGQLTTFALEWFLASATK